MRIPVILAALVAIAVPAIPAQAAPQRGVVLSDDGPRRYDPSRGGYSNFRGDRRDDRRDFQRDRRDDRRDFRQDRRGDRRDFRRDRRD